MCRIPVTWHDASAVNITIEKFCQRRKKKKSRPWLLNNRAIHCWRIAPVTVEELCQWLLKNRASHCWTIVSMTVEELCQWPLRNRASNCWIIVPVTVKQSCQWLLNKSASDCWTTVPATVQQVNTLLIMSVQKYLSGWARII